MSEIIECAGGLQPASPMPTPTRAAARNAKLRAAPWSAVIRLHTNSAIAMMFRRTLPSANRAIGMPSVA